MILSPHQKAQYLEEGYCVLESALPEKDLEGLRSECGRFIDMMNDEMDRQGADVLGINHRNKRYFVNKKYRESPILENFLFGSLMTGIAAEILGPSPHLFFEQYVVKFAEPDTQFAWHQDSAYLDQGVPHKPYLTVWCALDDVSEENGTIYVLPYSRAGGRSLMRHVKSPLTNDLVGYYGNDPGIPVVVPAGSIALFSSLTFHRSGANRSDRWRRVYLPQYSSEPILDPASGKPYQLAVPLQAQLTV